MLSLIQPAHPQPLLNPFIILKHLHSHPKHQREKEELTRKNNILDVFLPNNDTLAWQIIITETSMTDHNIIQIETNIKIVEEKQNHRIKKSNLSYRDLNFLNEDISWASIDAAQLDTSRDML